MNGEEMAALRDKLVALLRTGAGVSEQLIELETVVELPDEVQVTLDGTDFVIAISLA